MSMGRELARRETKAIAHRNTILDLEEAMHSMPEEDKRDIEELTSHFFAPGCYARMLFIPKGDVAIGKIHKTDHFNIICKGKVSVSTEDGPLIVDATARPQIVVSGTGVKKAVYAIEDTWWINIHVTDETDLDKIEDEVIAKDFAELEYQE